jgi:hypothetical protein
MILLVCGKCWMPFILDRLVKSSTCQGCGRVFQGGRY